MKQGSVLVLVIACAIVSFILILALVRLLRQNKNLKEKINKKQSAVVLVMSAIFCFQGAGILPNDYKLLILLNVLTIIIGSLLVYAFRDKSK